jgi:hypothetical protein
MSKQDEMFDEKIDWQARLTAKKSAKFDELYPAQEAALNSYSSGSRRRASPRFVEEISTGIEVLEQSDTAASTSSRDQSSAIWKFLLRRQVALEVGVQTRMFSGMAVPNTRPNRQTIGRSGKRNWPATKPVTGW